MLKSVPLLLCLLPLWLPSFHPEAELPDAEAKVRPRLLPSPLLADTFPKGRPYRGYRLFLGSFEVLKRSAEEVRLRLTVANTGRRAVDFRKPEMLHWVLLEFDPSLYAQKLGGLKEQILQALRREELVLPAGTLEERFELRVPFAPAEWQPQLATADSPPEPPDGGFTTIDARKGTDVPIALEEAPCPDVVFQSVRIRERSKKWVELEVVLLNQGPGPLPLHAEGKPAEHLALRYYLSGVPRLSRGALPIGGHWVQPENRPTLPPGETLTGIFRVDTRKKTRYVNQLILALEVVHPIRECDRTNNTFAISLE